MVDSLQARTAMSCHYARIQPPAGHTEVRTCPTLLMRITSLAMLFGLELLVFSLQIDSDLLSHRGGFVALLHPGHIWRAVIAFAALSVSFGFITARHEFQRISRSLSAIPIRWALIGAHLCAVLIFDVLSYRVASGAITATTGRALAAAWLFSGAGAAALGWFALVPWRVSRDLLKGARGVWIVAAMGAIFAVGIENLRPLLWGRAIGLTVNLVRVFLHPFVADLTVNPATGTFASHAFRLIITPECAGFEGAGLMLAFSLVWLFVFRKECRFPQAVLLIPVSVVAAWLLNSIRLTVLFLIGHAGAPGIALGGFHSQAGWIAFSGLALGFTLALQHVPGIRKGAPLDSANGRAVENPTAGYLMPFLVILATAMITRAASQGFDWLYPLRLFTAGLALWHYRRRYAQLDWKFGWAALLSGVIVFVMWLSLDWFTPAGSGQEIAAGLASLPTPTRTAWIVIRTLAASVTVPIAEELAFRGFILRRVVSPDFERVGPSRFTLLSFVVSSVAFGLLHGNRWVAGTLAGLLYAWVYRRRGRIGDAAAAHGITNALLALWVLLTRSWQMW